MSKDSKKENQGNYRRRKEKRKSDTEYNKRLNRKTYLRLKRRLSNDPVFKKEYFNKRNIRKKKNRRAYRADNPLPPRDKKPHPASKVCNGPCGEEKAYLEFSRGSRWCKTCTNERRRAREKERRSDPDLRAKVNSRKSERIRIRRKTDIQFKIASSLRHRLREVLRCKNVSSLSVSLLGCSLEYFRKHIESQFKRGMTWENWGTKWHLDHKFPCSKFDLTKPAEQRRCFHWTNFQPLTVEDNIRKGAKITEPQCQFYLMLDRN